jgi:hypothetical protein
MAGRAPGEVAGDDAAGALWRQLDYFPTPPWAARAGAEILLELDPKAASVWEPACGEGHMAAALGDYFLTWASDVHPFGFGVVEDFLDEAAAPELPAVDWIVSNPPFRTAGEFIRIGLKRARRGVAMLLRLQFLYGASPLTLCCPFAERVPMTLGRWDPAAASATAYAWLFWMKGARPMPLRGIAPGTKRRLTRAEDAARFGWQRPAGLLEVMGAEAGGPDDDEDSGVNDCGVAA